MTVYEVRQGAAGAGGSLPTLRAAAQVARAGDVVVVHAGVYRERLEPPARTTWRAAEGEGPIIDGGWDGKTVPTSTPAQVLVNKPNVVLRGFEIRHSPGQGVAVAAGGDDFLMEDCLISDCYNGGFVINGQGTPVSNVTARRTHMHRLSRSWVVQTNPTNVNTCCSARWGRNVLFEDCSVVGGYGEGMAAGVETIGMTIRGCLIADTMHLAVDASNRARDVVVENCIIFQTGNPTYRQGDGDYGTGIVVGDETRPDGKDDKWQHGDNIEVRYCLVVGSGALFQVRNQLKPAGGGAGQYDGYETRAKNLYVHHNTFIGGSNTKAGISLIENPIGHEVGGRFESNVIILDKMRDGAVLLNRGAKGVAFTGNAWSALPAARVPDGDRLITAAALVNPFAELTDVGQLNADNYRPTPGGPLVVDGAAIAGALGPDGPEPPVEPPPVDVPDWAALMALAASVGEQVAVVNMAAEAAGDALGELLIKLAEYEEAA